MLGSQKLICTCIELNMIIILIPELFNHGFKTREHVMTNFMIVWWGYLLPPLKLLYSLFVGLLSFALSRKIQFKICYVRSEPCKIPRMDKIFPLTWICNSRGVANCSQEMFVITWSIVNGNNFILSDRKVQKQRFFNGSYKSINATASHFQLSHSTFRTFWIYNNSFFKLYLTSEVWDFYS